MTFREAKQLSIVEYLSVLKYEPALIRGDDYWYHAPGRVDKEPSFKVENRKNLWYDHGDGVGGTIIDLGMKLHGCSAIEFLRMLSEGNFKNTVTVTPPSIHRDKRDNQLEIQLIKPLTNADLLHYINKRGIDGGLVELHCKEIDFSIKGRLYHAIGFPNRSGGWELRNAWFKGSSSPKDISIINHHSAGKLSVTEGFIDYLSLLKIEDHKIKSIIEGCDFMVLNSLSFLGRSIDLLKNYPDLNFFLDNDQAARKALAQLTSERIIYNDHSGLYSRHKDVNEFLMDRIKKSLVGPSAKKSKGHSL